MSSFSESLTIACLQDRMKSMRKERISSLKLIAEKNNLCINRLYTFLKFIFVQHSTRQSTDFRFILLQNLLAKVVSFGLAYFMKSKTSNTNLSEREFGKVRFYSTLSQARNLSRYALCHPPHYLQIEWSPLFVETYIFYSICSAFFNWY